MENNLKVFIGLGNPGPQFDWTRHNAGFIVMDILARRLGAHFLKDEELLGQVARAPFGNGEVVLLKPETGMNDSGKSVASAVAKLGISLDALLVVYDDTSLPLGKLRIRAKGSAGSHNGMRSIVSALGQENFARLRVMVGPDPGGPERYNFVLTPFPEPARESFSRLLTAAADAGRLWAEAGVDACAQRYNSFELSDSSL